MNFTTSSPWHENARIVFWLHGQQLPPIIGWAKISAHFNDPIHFDAQYVLPPRSPSLSRTGMDLFFNPRQLSRCAIGLFMATLWGGDSSLIRMANAGLWTGCILFLWSTCSLLGSHRAGAIAVLLLACHPELPLYFSTELTEPIFLFGLLAGFIRLHEY